MTKNQATLTNNVSVFVVLSAFVHIILIVYVLLEGALFFKNNWHQDPLIDIGLYISISTPSFMCPPCWSVMLSRVHAVEVFGMIAIVTFSSPLK